VKAAAAPCFVDKSSPISQDPDLQELLNDTNKTAIKQENKGSALKTIDSNRIFLRAQKIFIGFLSTILKYPSCSIRTYRNLLSIFAEENEKPITQRIFAHKKR